MQTRIHVRCTSHKRSAQKGHAECKIRILPHAIYYSHPVLIAVRNRSPPSNSHAHSVGRRGCESDLVWPILNCRHYSELERMPSDASCRFQYFPLTCDALAVFIK